MAKITIDNRDFEVDEQKNLLDTALSLGYDLPYFCWHPCLDSVGACRQCAVKQFKNADDDQGAIVMACMTPAADGTRIALNDAETVNFRASIIEWLMINHPHDCPVCEEGGECHLQDMTLMTGHTRRRYRGKKRTHRNQNLGPFIGHEMNRCIACYRCVRFYRDYAGGDDLEAFGCHDHVYFGRQTDGPLENEFSGNLVEVCPTGVFTDKPLGAHYTRKWDLENAPGICQHCSLGCNTSPGARQGLLKRIQNRYHGEINGYFLCDRGRFGGGFVNRDDRPRQALLKAEGNGLRPVATESARGALKTIFAHADGVVGIGSPRASLEGNFALRRLVGAAHFSTGTAAHEQTLVATALESLRANPRRNLSLRDTEHCDAVLILGEDVTNSAPRLALSLRQAVRNAGLALAAAHKIPRWHDRAVRDIAGSARSPLYQVTPAATKLDDVATRSIHARPQAIARLGFAVAFALDAQAPRPENIDEETAALADEIAGALRAAKHPLVVAGTGCGDPAILRAADNVAHALTGDAGLFLTLPECNSAGVGLLGGMDVEAALARIEAGDADTLVVLENDLYRRAPKAQVDAALAKVRNLIVLDHSLQPTLARADVALPAGSFAEADGTLVNNEGRAQRFFQVFMPQAPVQESWRWCADLMTLSGRNPGWAGLDDVLAALVAQVPTLAGAGEAAPNASFRLAGMRIPREPHRYSGRTALTADRSVHERRPAQDADSPLAYSMEGWPGRRPAALLPFAWAPGWDSNQQAITRFQDEVGGHLRGGDAGVQLFGTDGAGTDYASAQLPPDTPDWLAVALPQIFGSEAQSALAPAVAERAPAAFVALRPDDAERLGVGAGELLAVTLSGQAQRLPVRLLDSLPPATIGIPVGLGGLTGLQLPQQVTL